MNIKLDEIEEYAQKTNKYDKSIWEQISWGKGTSLEYLAQENGENFVKRDESWYLDEKVGVLVFVINERKAKW